MIYNDDNLTFKILGIAKWQHKNGLLDVAPRPFSALSYRLSGNATFYVNEEKITINEGDVLFIPANCGYKVDYSFSESIVFHLLDCNCDEVQKLTSNNVEQLKSKFISAMSLWKTTHSYNKLKSYVYDILTIFEEDHSTLFTNTEILEVINYIKSNLTTPQLTVEEICNRAHISRSTLQRHFNKYFNMGVKEYIIKQRLNVALNLLSNGKYTIKEIAFASGFNDEKYFSRAFKKVYGFSPSDFNIKF
ncbi:MAG: helix-turn-helix domain-containing protein [Clostridia bacterium]|nr:helix-turn-helix domain-containing protein [Clostridia bacterium]